MYTFVRQYSEASTPGNGRRSDECNAAFQRLKSVLTLTPVLSYPLPGGRFVIDSDAKDRGIGAVLSQEQGGQERAIAYFSRTLSRAGGIIASRDDNYWLW